MWKNGSTLSHPIPKINSDRLKAKSIIIKELEEKRKVHTPRKTGKMQNLSLKETTDRFDYKKSKDLYVMEKTPLES